MAVEEPANCVFGLKLVKDRDVSFSCACRCAANIRSARLPCRSDALPMASPPSAVSFLKAYCTVICLFPKNSLCMQSMAMSDASKESYATKPNPLLSFVSSSLAIFGDRISVPNAEKVS